MKSVNILQEVLIGMEKNTYVIQYAGELYAYPCIINQRGFTYDEAEVYIKNMKWENAKLISIEEEIEKYKLQGNPEYKILMDPKVYAYETWRNAYMDNNINGIKLPVCIETNEEYIDKLERVYEKYLNEINKPAFAYEKGLLGEIENTCHNIIKILKLLIKGDISFAEQQLKDMVEKFSVQPFFVSELDKSYSFRGIAPFIDLQSSGYEEVYKEMCDKELTFFRVRTKNALAKDDISKLAHIVHLPYKMKKKASNMRFSRIGSPCLYLGTTTYVCCRECDWDDSSEEMFVASFIPNKQGKKLRILNLTISQALINGIYNKGIDDSGIRSKLQIMMLKLFPLVIATSFSIKEKNREIKYEYLISQALMKVINEIGIDGIAYLSMKGKDEFQYPQGVNLALPAWDITEKKQYSSICDAFNISLPIKFNHQDNGIKKSYINAIYRKEDKHGLKNYISKLDVDGKEIFYEDTKYGKFDDYLVSQPLNKFED